MVPMETGVEWRCGNESPGEVEGEWPRSRHGWKFSSTVKAEVEAWG
jgi:hypothetical protein